MPASGVTTVGAFPQPGEAFAARVVVIVVLSRKARDCQCILGAM